MTKNKLQITYFKDKLKTFEAPRPVKIMTGKNYGKLKVRGKFLDVNGKVDSQKCMSIEQAQKQFSKFNIKNVNKAVFYDQLGMPFVIYDHAEGKVVEELGNDE